jgi:hypothetical protein
MSIAIRSPDASIVAAASSAPQPGKSAPADPVKNTASAAPSATVKLSPEAIAIVLKLQARDSQVRLHELAHLAASGGLATSGPIYSYQRGPDGNSYAVGGEVNIDVSPGRTPQETIARAQTIQAAALAPADPSDADRAVALRAQQMEQQAQVELQQLRLDKERGARSVGQHIDVQA